MNVSHDAAVADVRDRLLTPVFKRLLLVHVAFGFCASVFLILPKFFAADLHAGPTAIGVVMAMSGVANVVAARRVRRLVERLGHTRILRFGSLAMAAGGLLYMFVDHIGPLAIGARALQGLGYACVFTAGSTLAANLAPPGRMAQAIGVFAAALLGTNALGPALAELLLAFVPPPVVWLVGAGFGLVSYLVAGGLAAFEDPPAPVPPPSESGAGDAFPIAYFVAWTALGLASGTVFAFHQPFALQRGFSHVSGFLAGFTLSAVVVRVLTGRLLDRLGHRRVASTMLIGYGIMLIAMNWLGTIDLVVLGVGVGLAHGSFYPAMMALCVSDVSPRHRPRVVTSVNVGSQFGTMNVMWLGLVAARWGYATIFVLVGAATALAGLVLLLRRPISVGR